MKMDHNGEYEWQKIAKTDLWSDTFSQALTTHNPHFKGIGGRNALFETTYLLNNIEDISHKASDVMYLTRLYDAKIHYVLIDFSNAIVEQVGYAVKNPKSCTCGPREACSDCP